MKRNYLFDVAFVAVIGLAAVVVSVAVAADDTKSGAAAGATATPAAAKDSAQSKIPEMKLPPGWTADILGIRQGWQEFYSRVALFLRRALR